MPKKLTTPRSRIYCAVVKDINGDVLSVLQLSKLAVNGKNQYLLIYERDK